MAALFSSCEQWFDVTPPSQIREEKHFDSPVGYEQALIGCYIAMCDDYLYNKYLTWHMPEVLARQFEPYVHTSSTNVDYPLQNYSYKTAAVANELDKVWLKGYNVIANANNALKFVDQKGKNILHPTNYKLIKGELLAIRAYMHFDLLRLYGYGNWANRSAELNEKLTLPYATLLSKEETPQFKGKEFIAALHADIDEALALLADVDPVLRSLLGSGSDSFYDEVNAEGFYDNRKLRLNYFAVQALKARVLTWEGTADGLKKAREIAEEVIEYGVKSSAAAIKWMTIAETNRDMSMTQEGIFVLNVKDLAAVTAPYISPQLSINDMDKNVMYMTDADAKAIYESAKEGHGTDWRLSNLMASVREYYVPLKMIQTSSFYYPENRIPLIRLPELYYIAAEGWLLGSQPDPARTLSLLNEVRDIRGISVPLDSGLTTEAIREEIKKEYRKEFISEGIAFFYYKRTGEVTIPHYLEEMTDNQYVLPFPENEINYGRVQ